jgi:hypothetical protein
MQASLRVSAQASVRVEFRSATAFPSAAAERPNPMDKYLIEQRISRS